MIYTTSLVVKVKSKIYIYHMFQKNVCSYNFRLNDFTRVDSLYTINNT